jgi:adenylylsulfate reductase, subunit B
MGLKIAAEKCTGCGKCVDICPGDLLSLGPNGKSFLREQGECWDCMACVKSCPAQALETRLPFSLADYGASLKPQITPNEIRWICSYPDGRVEEFVVPRTKT